MKSRRVSITDHSFTLSSSEDDFHFYPTLSVFIRKVFPYFLIFLCSLIFLSVRILRFFHRAVRITRSVL